AAQVLEDGRIEDHAMHNRMAEMSVTSCAGDGGIQSFAMLGRWQNCQSCH
ncbi:hypothetical protein L195_g050605, partial [Trifolium pratense]